MHSDTQFFDSKNLSRPLVIIPFGLIFIVNLIITQVNGFGYAGELAIFSAASSFLAILFSMQWDIEILIRDKDKMLSRSRRRTVDRQRRLKDEGPGSARKRGDDDEWQETPLYYDELQEKEKVEEEKEQEEEKGKKK